MKRLLGSTRRPSRTPALDTYRRNLAAVESSRVAMWLSTEAPDAGFPDPWPAIVADLEAEGNAVLGAVPCPHGDHLDVLGGETRPRQERPCPSCRAAL